MRLQRSKARLRQRSWRAGTLLLLAAPILLTGCAAAPEAPSSQARRIPDDAPFLLAPARGYGLSLSAAVSSALRDAHSNLVQLGLFAEARATSAMLLQVDPDLAPAIVLEAQALLVAGQTQAARARVEPVVRLLPEYDAALLLLGRVSEKMRLPVEAMEAYGALRERSRLADSRFRAVQPSALEELETEIITALGTRRLEHARDRLDIMKRWAAEAISTLRVTAEVAAAEGSSIEELTALRKLSRQISLGKELLLRQASLELEVGDASAGLRVFQNLAASEPTNERLATELARAQFLWRLSLLPAKVKSVAAIPELTRSDFAVLLYWLFPSVRYGQADEGRIANDVLDHPHRQEIVRVANLGLMSVDPRLHRFSPDRQISRAAAMTAIQQVLGRQRPRPSCLRRSQLGTRVPSSQACDLSVRCGLLDKADLCLPEAPTSGYQALEWIRRALDQIAVDQG